MTGGHPSRTRSLLWALVAAALVALGLSTAAPAGAAPAPLSVTPTSGTGGAQVAVALDPSWAADCVIGEFTPMAVNFQTSATLGTGILNSVLLTEADPGYATTVDLWFDNVAYSAGTYWFVGFCSDAEGNILETNAVPFEVTAANVPEALLLGLSPATGTATTAVTASVGPPEPSFFEPCAPSLGAVINVSTSSNVLDSAAVLTRTAIEDPAVTIATTKTLSEWVGATPTQAQYWFFASCPFVNDGSFTAYSPAVAFAVDLPATTITPAPPATQAVEVTPAFTG